MAVLNDAMMLRVFIGEDARFQRRPLYQAIVLKAREAHLAGATVLRGVMGFGRSGRLHTWKILRLYEDMPLIVEIVDTEEKIKSFLPTLDAMMPGGIVTLGRVQVSQYRADVKQEPS
jgi:PII-like signaling protein